MNVLTAILFVLREFAWPLIRDTAIIWAPLICIFVGGEWWLEYVRKEPVAKAKWTMIEIKIPKDVWKSPMAIEIILNSLHGDTKPPLFTPKVTTKWSTMLTDFGKWYAATWLGVWPLWWSLEIASIEGNIYFFIRCEMKNREGIENLIYSQFPQAEITEVDDYTRYVPPFKAGSGWDLRGCEYKLKETFAPDPKDKDTKFSIDALPIKTYIEYGLHEAFNLEEEQKIDPMVSLLQVLGSLGTGEQAWIQIVMQGSWAHFDNPDATKKADKPYISWQDVGRFYIDNFILKPYQVKIGETDDGKPKFDSGERNMPQREKVRLEALERALIKPGYDCGIRIVYLGKGTNFKAGKLGEIKNAWKQFNAPNLNSFEAVNGTDDGFDFPWQDYKDLRKINNREKMFKRYVKREFFYPPEMGATVKLKKILDAPLINGTLKKPETSVLNTEELATIFHFPGRVATTPAIGRIEAQKVEPPANLPI